MTNKLTGGCLCGNVRYEITAEIPIVGICYCRQCQKAGGSESAQAIGIPSASFNLLKGSVKTYESMADSGSPVRRCFCDNCGSQLMAYPLGFPDIMSVKVCSLDDPTPFRPQFALHTESAQPWTNIPDDIPTFPKAPSSAAHLMESIAEANR